MILTRLGHEQVREQEFVRIMDDKSTAALRGYHPQDNWFDSISRPDHGSLRGVRPDGSLVFVVLRGCLSAGALLTAWKSLRRMNAPPTNRGSAAGRDGMGRSYKSHPAIEKDGKIYRSRTDNIRASTAKHLRLGSSGVIGALDRDERYPYCRIAGGLKSRERMEACLPLAREVDQVFSYAVPDRYAQQKAIADRTLPCWRFGDTVFTTVTVNKNFRCGTHQDDGDYKPGFSNLVMIRAGQFRGGFLVLPQYRHAIELHTGDALYFDPHEWHGTSEIEGLRDRYERITLVMYYRTAMAECGTVEQEQARAREITKVDLCKASK